TCRTWRTDERQSDVVQVAFVRSPECRSDRARVSVTGQHAQGVTNARQVGHLVAAGVTAVSETCVRLTPGRVGQCPNLPLIALTKQAHRSAPLCCDRVGQVSQCVSSCRTDTTHAQLCARGSPRLVRALVSVVVVDGDGQVHASTPIRSYVSRPSVLIRMNSTGPPSAARATAPASAGLSSGGKNTRSPRTATLGRCSATCSSVTPHARSISVSSTV